MKNKYELNSGLYLNNMFLLNILNINYKPIYIKKYLFTGFSIMVNSCLPRAL
ncbi:hypothetical protein SAMN05880573_101191 [Chryseobacterium sp. RU33C]|nr:hypothetical protein SAMN05880573_101191 [Chryseobacterium sp. RU33C]